jgi:xanthine permease XanP
MKPANLVYGVEEQPPPMLTVVSAIQHVGVIAIFMIYPLIIGRHAGIPADQMANILRMSMLALAVATFLQALSIGPVGSRFLAPSSFSGIYLGPSLLAVELGGLPLVWGMTIFAGLTEIVLSRLWPRLRTFIPSETAGLIVFLVGVIVGLAALRLLLGNAAAGSLAGSDGIVTGVMLAVMIALNIWNKGRLRLFCILIGMIVGYVVSAATGLLTAADFHTVLNQPLIAAPTTAYLSWSFDPSMIVPFAVSGLAAAMSTTAVVTTYQKTTDADWVRPDMASIKRGILGDGIAASVAGLLGTYGLTVASTNVGLVAATGVASRRIAFVIAAILYVVAFQPGLIGLLTIMPPPVMSAAMLFTSVFIMISGIQIISSRILDSRRTLVIGMAMMAFFVVSVFPAAFAGAPRWAQPLVGTPLVLATLVALVLNLVFRLGIRKTVAMSVDPATAYYEAVRNFIEHNSGIWGARRDVVNRVEFAVHQAIETIIEYCQVNGPIELKIGYDEFDIDVSLSYVGAELELSDRMPSHDEILETPDSTRRLAGFLIKRQSDKVQVTSGAGTARVRLHFRQ